jgi:hypothetical protein
MSLEVSPQIDNYVTLSADIYSLELLFYFISQRKHFFLVSNDDLKILVSNGRLFL